MFIFTNFRKFEVSVSVSLAYLTFDCLFTRMASNRDFYRPTLTALEVIDEINNDLDSDEEDLNEGKESYDDEEGGDIFTNLMREAIDQSLDLDLSPSDLEDGLDFDLQDSHRSSSPIDVVDLQNNAERQRGRGLQRGVGRGRGRGERPNLIEHWDEAAPEAPNNIEFRRRPGLSVDASDFTLAQYLELFFNEDLFNNLPIQTNLYASQYIDAQPNLPPHSRVQSWTETDNAEMKKFLGLILLTGIVKMPSYEKYWSNNKNLIYHHPIFGAVTTRNRFQLILRFLHFHDNENMLERGQPGYDRLYKIRPILDHLFEKFQEIYTPRRDICVDESLLLWKGRLIFRQYLPLKRARFGIKIFLCCESDGGIKGSGGYCSKFRIYTGKEDPALEVQNVIPDDAQHLSMSEQMVVYLILPFLHQGYTTYMDNWYSSLRLYLYLLSKNT